MQKKIVSNFPYPRVNNKNLLKIVACDFKILNPRKNKILINSENQRRDNWKTKKYIATIDSLVNINNRLRSEKDSVITVNKNINWKNTWNMRLSIIKTADWYLSYFKKKNLKKITSLQIREYFNLND